MTGEGIHTAMESGKTAASVLEDALTVGNFDAAVLEEYQNRWLNSFGTDFYWYVCHIALVIVAITVKPRLSEPPLSKTLIIQIGIPPTFSHSKC